MDAAGFLFLAQTVLDYSQGMGSAVTLSAAVADVRHRLAANIRYHRLRLGLTRGQFAQKMRVNIRNLEQAESPTGANLNLSSIVHVAHVLGVDTVELLTPRPLPLLKRGRAGEKQRNEFSS